MDRTAARGGRSAEADDVFPRAGRRVLSSGGGDDDVITVEDVGIGVGYFCFL